MESEGGTKKRSRFFLKEPLKVGRRAEVPGSVVEVLACHQLEGIRFIHRGLKQNKGVILNDESGLGKTHQVVGYLSATVGTADKGAIVCSSLERIHHWLYHLELLTELTTVVLEDVDSDHLSGNHQIILATFESFEKQSDSLLSKEKEIKLLVIDETKNEHCEISLLTLISKFTTTAKLFLTTQNILDDLVRLSLRLKLCHLQFHGETLKELLEGGNANKPLSKSRKLKLFFLTRSVLLRRYRSHHKNILPLIEDSEFRFCFAAWKIANGMEGCQSQVLLEDSQILVDQSIVPEVIESTSGLMFNPELGENDTVCDTSLNMAIVGEAESSGIGRDLSHDTDDGNNRSAATVAYKGSEPLFDCEQSTEEMPKLVLESSDSETKSPVDKVRKSPLAKVSESEMTQSKTRNIEVPETERSSPATEHQTDSEGYLEFGQALVQPSSQSESSSETLVRKSATVLADDKYNFPIDRLLRWKSPSSSSTDLEVLSKESVLPNQPILVSSSSSNGREKSPDLFSDTDEEADETVKLGTQDDSLMNLLLKSPVNLETTSKPDVPKPLPKFLRAKVSTPISKLLHGSLHEEPDLSVERSSSNDIFADLSVKNRDPNRTDVFEITDNNAFGNRIQVHAESDSMSPLRDSDDVQFVSVLRGPDNQIEIVDLDTEVCTPKSQNGAPPNRAKRTPSSKESLFSTPRGWLTKGNRSSDSEASPRTPTTGRKSSSTERAKSTGRRSTGSSNVKRKKLENWFRDDDDDDFEDRQRVSTSVNRRKSAPSSSAGCVKRISPRKKCFQDRIYQRYNQILVSPSGVDSDFE
ncbi:uncharacterized protein SuUR [Ochlerotatus camptorhynchus]|uniref:uncharacterized protein SuUR n=1 Tax=Ochlerotatus camptorhynchus TaxID=644619 RepID=UPI0031E06AE8